MSLALQFNPKLDRSAVAQAGQADGLTDLEIILPGEQFGDIVDRFTLDRSN